MKDEEERAVAKHINDYGDRDDEPLKTPIISKTAYPEPLPGIYNPDTE